MCVYIHIYMCVHKIYVHCGKMEVRRQLAGVSPELISFTWAANLLPLPSLFLN